MELSKVLKHIAKEVNGTLNDYDNTTSFFVVPLNDGRFQTVKCTVRQFENLKHQIIEISSKVCDYKDTLNCKELLEENTKFCHAKFSVVDDYLYVEGSAYVSTVEEFFLKEILMEVAQLADDWEFKLTGLDVN